MKFVFITMPAKAHLNPTLGIVSALVKQGHQVIVYNTTEFAEQIRDAGAEFRGPMVKVPDFKATIGKDALTITQFLLDTANLLVQPLITQIKQDRPDCIVHDCLNIWGKITAKAVSVPAICLVPTFVLTPKLFLQALKYLYPDYGKFLSHPRQILQIRQKYRSLYLRMGLQPPPLSDLFINRENLNIVFTSRYFQPHSTDFGQDYQFVGPIIYDRHEQNKKPKLIKNNQPIIYLSLGTIYNNRLDFYRQWLTFFRDIPYQVYMSTGPIDPKNLGNIPANVRINHYWPQLEILSKATLFITHGGMNSVNESLYYGVPMLLFPQIHEQKINAARVEQLSAGLWYKQKELDTNIMQDMVQTLTANDSYRKHALALGKTLQAAGGIDRAVKCILTNSDQ